MMQVKDIKGSGLERAAKYLKDVVGIDGFTADKQWEQQVFIGWRNFTIYELVVCFNQSNSFGGY